MIGERSHICWDDGRSLICWDDGRSHICWDDERSHICWDDERSHICWMMRERSLILEMMGDRLSVGMIGERIFVGMMSDRNFSRVLFRGCLKSLNYYSPWQLEVSAIQTKPTYSFGTLRERGFKSLNFPLVHLRELSLCSSVRPGRCGAILYSPTTFQTSS